MSWELPLLTTLVLVALSLWWPRYSTTTSALVKATGGLLAVVALLVNPRALISHPDWPNLPDIGNVRLDVLILSNIKMIITFAAVAW